MSILQVLEESLASDAPAYMEFLYRYDPKKKQVFAFYEGDEDSSFYHQILERNINPDFELEEIVAGCKNNVLKLNREFNWGTYNKQQILFFVDRDLSFWLNEKLEYDDNVFVTDGYSVENYIVCPRAFRTLLQMFKGFARASKPEIDNMVAIYIALEKNFDAIMVPIMARAIVAKRHDKSIHLSDYKMSKNLHFSISESQVTVSLSDDETCFAKWGLCTQYEEEITNQIELIIKNIEHYSVRGKWILFFMAELGEFMRLHADHFAPSLEFSGKIPATCSIASSQCLPALAPHCNTKTPERLQRFLSNTYGVFFQPVA